MMKEDIQRAPLRRNSYEIPSRPALTYKLYAKFFDQFKDLLFGVSEASPCPDNETLW
jgi:hypothetical protein